MSKEAQIETSLVLSGAGYDRFTEEQQEEIRYIVRRILYADFNVTPAIVMLGLSRSGYEISRQLAQHYIAQVRKQDAEAERILADTPDLVETRARHRKYREAVFNASMADKQLAQANRALDALAALDNIAVAKSTVAVEGKDGGPLQFEDVTLMSDSALRATLATLRARQAEESGPEA